MSICNLDFFKKRLYNDVILIKGVLIMATEKKPTMLRLTNEMYEKVRYLAYLEHRSMNAEIEYALFSYISDYEKQHGVISIPDPSTGNQQ